jgi:hypothetical protein
MRAGAGLAGRVLAEREQERIAKMMAILSDIVEALSNTGCYGRWEKAEVNMARGGERTPSIPRIALASAQQFGRYWMHCGHRPKWTPAACEAIDPDVWSGRALQEGFVDLADAAFHQCIRSLIGAPSRLLKNAS